MSGVARNALELLRPQIEELGSLRNASTRDPRFKQWRQNTLTVIQRIWPGDATRSERFRRVPFSPPSVKHDVKTGRDYFERGCAEAYEYLNLLLSQIESSGVAPPAPAVPTASAPPPAPAAVASPEEPSPFPEEPEELPGDYPTIELPGDATPQRPAAGPPRIEPARATPPVKPSPGPPPVPRAASRPPGPAPLPRVSVRGEPRREGDSGSKERANPLSDILSAVPPPTPPTSAERPARSNRARKVSGKQRLKEMLGLSEMAAGAPAPPAGAAPGASAARPPVEAAPHVGPPLMPPAEKRREEPPRPEPSPAQAAADELALSEIFDSVQSPLPLTPADLEVASGSLRDPELEELESMAALGAEIPDEAEPDPPVPEAELDEEGEGADADATARMTAEFVLNSPVLSSQARPVQRRGAPTPAAQAEPLPTTPSAVLMQIADEVEQLGVPEGQRAMARATIVDLARLIDSREMSWESLRGAIQFVMEFPPLARKALPLLLPFLDIAA